MFRDFLGGQNGTHVNRSLCKIIHFGGTFPDLTHVKPSTCSCRGTQIILISLMGCTIIRISQPNYEKKRCWKGHLFDPSQQNRAVVCYQEKCDITFIWKSILSTQRWYHSCVNWMQHCNFMVKNKSLFLFIFFVFSHTNAVISWNTFYRQLPCFDVMGHR